MLKFITQDCSEAIMVSIEGRIIYETEKDFKETISGLLKNDKNRIVLDCSGLSYINSAGLGVLINLLKSSKAQGGDIRLAGLNPDIRELFEITNLNHIFSIFKTSDEAVKSFL